MFSTIDVQFISFIPMQSRNEKKRGYGKEYNNYSNDNSAKNNNTTLLWGINIIASLIRTIVAVVVTMMIGFN